MYITIFCALNFCKITNCDCKEPHHFHEIFWALKFLDPDLENIIFRLCRFILGDVQPHYECAPLLIPRTQAPVTSCHRLVLKKKTMSNFEEFIVSNRMKSKFNFDLMSFVNCVNFELNLGLTSKID